MEESVFDDVVISAWSGFAPYIMPIVFLVLAITFRVWLSEIAAEIVFVFRQKLSFLLWGRKIVPGQAEALRRVWADICEWNKAYRSSYSITEQSAVAINGATLDLISALELGLPYYDDEARQSAEEIMRECVRELQIWQGAKEKSEAFLRDYHSALDKIENKITNRLMPHLEALLRG